MPESAEELLARVEGALTMPAFTESTLFPFEGEFRIRELDQPADEPPRGGAGGVDCWSCEADDDKFVWTDDDWRISAPKKPSGFPAVLFLHPRQHFDGPGDLPDARADELGRAKAKKLGREEEFAAVLANSDRTVGLRYRLGRAIAG